MAWAAQPSKVLFLYTTVTTAVVNFEISILKHGLHGPLQGWRMSPPLRKSCQAGSGKHAWSLQHCKGFSLVLILAEAALVSCEAMGELFLYLQELDDT